MFKFFCIFLVIAAPGCACFKRLPPADLSEPGWTVRQGQAVWHQAHGGVDLAGEFLVATRVGGEVFVQFSKPPFPVVTAQVRPGKWQIEMPARDRRYCGPGKPPRRFAWLHLPSALRGEDPPAPWTWNLQTNRWRLENAQSGERLEGFFAE